MSVNVSSRQLKRGDLVESVAHALDSTGLPPSMLEIELTEGTLVEDTKLAAQTLEPELRQSAASQSAISTSTITADAAKGVAIALELALTAPKTALTTT